MKKIPAAPVEKFKTLAFMENLFKGSGWGIVVLANGALLFLLIVPEIITSSNSSMAGQFALVMVGLVWLSGNLLGFCMVAAGELMGLLLSAYDHLVEITRHLRVMNEDERKQ